MAPSQLGLFTPILAGLRHAEPEYHIQPLSLDKFGEPLHAFPAITASVCNLRPASRGSMHAEVADPPQPPAIAPNYLAAEEDRRVAVDALKLVRAHRGRAGAGDVTSRRSTSPART